MNKKSKHLVSKMNIGSESKPYYIEFNTDRRELRGIFLISLIFPLIIAIIYLPARITSNNSSINIFDMLYLISFTIYIFFSILSLSNIQSFYKLDYLNKFLGSLATSICLLALSSLFMNLNNSLKVLIIILLYIFIFAIFYLLEKLSINKKITESLKDNNDCKPESNSFYNKSQQHIWPLILFAGIGGGILGDVLPKNAGYVVIITLAIVLSLLFLKVAARNLLITVFVFKKDKDRKYIETR